MRKLWLEIRRFFYRTLVLAFMSRKESLRMVEESAKLLAIIMMQYEGVETALKYLQSSVADMDFVSMEDGEIIDSWLASAQFELEFIKEYTPKALGEVAPEESSDNAAR